jgi:hypothetical protein
MIGEVVAVSVTEIGRNSLFGTIARTPGNELTGAEG